MQGCQTAVNTSSTPALVPTTPQSDGSRDPKALIRSICDGNRFFAELCKYLASETQDLENSLRSILYDVISECAALTSLLTSAPLLFAPPNPHLLTPTSDSSNTIPRSRASPNCSPPYSLHSLSMMTVLCYSYRMHQPAKYKPWPSSRSIASTLPSKAMSLLKKLSMTPSLSLLVPIFSRLMLWTIARSGTKQLWLKVS